ncbi:MAG: hypothetical protein KC615_00740 [Anaerolineae bacterium]|nr:hypothetical protein [Anaerolineae bacterium]
MNEENLTPSELDNPEDEVESPLEDELSVAEPDVQADTASDEADLGPDTLDEAVDSAESVADVVDEVGLEVLDVDESTAEEVAQIETDSADESADNVELFAESDEASPEEPDAVEVISEEIVEVEEQASSADVADSEWAPREDHEPEPMNSSGFPAGDEFDVSAALAAVASLDRLTSDEIYEAEEEYEEYDFAEQGEYVPSDVSAFGEVTPVPAFPESTGYMGAGYTQGAAIAHPDMFALRRGQVASVVPALLLIGLGAWLTFMTTTADESSPQIDPLLILIALVGVLSIGLLSHWWTSRRWARGSFFLSMTLLAMSAVGFFLIQSGGMSIATGWPLLIAGVGIALFLTGLLTQPRSLGLVGFGIMMALLSAVATSVTAELLPVNILSLAADAWPVAAVIAVLLLLVPVIRR